MIYLLQETHHQQFNTITRPCSTLLHQRPWPSSLLLWHRSNQHNQWTLSISILKHRRHPQTFYMDGMKDTTTPINSTTTLQLHDSTRATDVKMYRSLIGSLQYLSFTCFDIAYTVNKLSQFLQSPIQLHWITAK